MGKGVMARYIYLQPFLLSNSLQHRISSVSSFIGRLWAEASCERPMAGKD